MRRTFPIVAATAIALTVPVSTLADIRVSFRDGAPKDTFTITNTGACASGPAELTIDLTESGGKLIFDVTSGGAGVEVFQPLEFTQGASYLATIPKVVDGQKTLSLRIATLPQDGTITFTIDVDDTNGAREITVNGSEMGGSTLMVQLATMKADAVFDTSAVALVETPACSS